MKKVFYVMLAVLLAGTVSMNAQVRIGNTTDPHAGAVLDLKSTETTGKGVLFPSVNLLDVDVFQLSGDAAKGEGMIIYNTNEAIGKGLYLWDGEKWNKVSGMGEDPTSLILAGTPADWVSVDPTPNSGDGTQSNPYLNTCPGTTVILAPQSGYTFGAVEPEDAASPYLSGLLKFTTSGSVVVNKGRQSGTVYVAINSCSVPVTGVTVSPTTATLTAVNQTQQLTATVVPTNATNKAVSWTSSNTTVATVDANGLVTAKGSGSATITVKTTDGNKIATSTITVNIPVTGVTLTPATATLTAVNQTQQLNATVAPTNATNKAVTWTSSDTAVATVDTNGLVTAKGSGTATITVKTTDGNKTATSTITVNIPVTGVTVTPTTVTLTAINQTQQLTATVAPTNAANKAVTWTSSNTAVATVDADGLVTAVAAGTAVITVTTDDGDKTATSTITVSIPNADGTYNMQIGNNTYKTFDYDGKVWMVENSREGSGFHTHYSTNYYPITARFSACPAGWHLPSVDEIRLMCTWLIKNSTAPSATFWKWQNGPGYEYNGIEYFPSLNKALILWGSGPQYNDPSVQQPQVDVFYHIQNYQPMVESLEYNSWMPVRCVKN